LFPLWTSNLSLITAEARALKSVECMSPMSTAGLGGSRVDGRGPMLSSVGPFLAPIEVKAHSPYEGRDDVCRTVLSADRSLCPHVLSQVGEGREEGTCIDPGTERREESRGQLELIVLLYDSPRDRAQREVY
jgi:hypothetical protein